MPLAPPPADAGATHILIVDADVGVAALLRKAFTGEGFQVTQSQSAATARDRLADAGISLVTLDLDLPDADGIELLREIRARSSVPIIVVSRRSRKITKIVCLEMGADDYLVKPADGDELIARVRAVLRRTQREAPANGYESPAQSAYRTETVTFEGWRFDMAGQRLWSPRKTPVHLTGTESDLLAIFTSKARTRLSRAEIATQLRGSDDGCDARSIDVLVKKVRAKLAEHAPDTDFIKTVRGAGYLFSLDVRPAA